MEGAIASLRSELKVGSASYPLAHRDTKWAHENATEHGKDIKAIKAANLSAALATMKHQKEHRGEPIPPEGQLPIAEVTPPQQRILECLGGFAGINRPHVKRNVLAIFAGASPTSGAYGNNLSVLRSFGLIDYPSPGYVCLTEFDGRADLDNLDLGFLKAVPESFFDALTDAQASILVDIVQANPGKVPTLEAYHNAWLNRLTAAQRSILLTLINMGHIPLDRAQLADVVGASPTSGAYGNNLSELRSLGLIKYPSPGLVTTTDLLFPGLK